MRRLFLRHLISAALVVFLVLAGGAIVWVGAVERWIGQELRELAAAHLVPSFAFDDLTYTFPSTITVHGARLTSPDPEAPDEPIEILAMDSFTLVLTDVPRPNRPFRIKQLALAHPMLHIVVIPGGAAQGNVLGFSRLFTAESESTARPARQPTRLSELFQVREVSIEGGRVRFDPRDGSATIMLIDGIIAKLLLQPDDAGAYDVDFALDHHPVFKLALRGKLFVDVHRLEVDDLAVTLQLAREQDHFLTPPMQKFVATNDITGRLSVRATGTIPLDDAASSQLQAHLELSDAGFAAGEYGLVMDRVDCRISATGRAVTIEEFVVDTLLGHVEVRGGFELDDSLTGTLNFAGSDLEIGNLLRGSETPMGLPAFSGLLDFTGTLRGPLADLDQRARGQGRLSIRKARLGRLPTLSTIDEALDHEAEAAMKKEQTGHDELSLDFSLDGDHARIGKLRMNSRWYGLRAHGDVGFDSRLDLVVTGGPLQRIENELGALGDVLGEISETLVRARVTGTLAEPKIGIEVLRQHHQ